MLKKIFLIVSIALLGYLGFTLYDTYLATHPYYETMMSTSRNRKVVIRGAVFSLIPAAYIVFAKRKSMLGLVGSLFVGLALFGVTYVSLKGGVGGFIKLIFNSAILLFLAIYMIAAFRVVGDWVKQKIFGLSTEDIYDVLLSTGVGLVIFLVINHILILLNLFYPIVTRAMFVGAGVMMWLQRERMSNFKDIIVDTLDFSRFEAWQTRVLLFLLMVSFMYLFNGFYLADIAYSTAWDANHAYMFFPKMWALNNGYYRNEIAMATSPQLRYSFIAFWFSLFSWTGGIGGISADTIAISMNFWSGIFVLIFGLGTISELLQLLKSYKSDHSTHFDFSVLCVGRLLLLLRLTSGMGAFLVFIDNKTDLGVWALIILAIYSGLVALRTLMDHDNASSVSTSTQDISGDSGDSISRSWKFGLSKNQFSFLALSGIFYAIAGLAKPTALFDVANFGLFARWIRLGGLGVLGAFLLILGGMSIIKFRGIQDYVSPDVGKISAVLGLLGLGGDVIRQFVYKQTKYLGYLMVRGLSFLLVYLLFKIPFWTARTIIYDDEVTPGKFIERVLFSSAEDKKKEERGGLTLSDQIPLYAQLGNTNATSCTLQGQGFTDVQQLYDNILEAPGDTYAEDVGRYIGFGWKGNENDARKKIGPFANPWRAGFLGEGCYGFNPFNPDARKAKVLCQNETARKDTKDVTGLTALQQQFDPSTEVYTDLQTLIDASRAGEDKGAYTETINNIQGFMQGNTIKVAMENGTKNVYFPYRFLNFWNITYNRSLQNTSSYYTDIGVPWLALIFFSLLGLVYGLISRHRILSAICAVTLFGRVLRFFIGGGILRYGIGIVIRSIMSFVVFLSTILDDSDGMRSLSWILLGCVAIFGLIQLVLNFVRLASQGGQGAFMRYKSNTGQVSEYDERLQPVRRSDHSFGAQDVFNLQFPHYNKFINAMNLSSPEEGALIAGTYSRYFVEDQSNVVYDQFLTWMREQTSDGDVCNSYLRLKDQNKKYIVIDPNIGTVVQGAGNQSLFDRFFARVDTDKAEIVEDGVMTMLAKMVEAGHLKYYSSNNIGSKYAYMLPDTSFGSLDASRRILERARLSVPRFFGSQALDNIVQIAQQRVEDGSFVEDLADMTGKQINSQALRTILSQPQIDPRQIANLTQDDRFVLVQYLGLRQAKQQSPEQFATQLNNMIKKNIGSGSQIIVLEVQ